ncbi:MAG: formylglycine-generating enzyme family protein [Gammaproteobacteria bacterium]|nr:formylglycine-generating enzyme family protein [Gammaproteobacteria bacterium]
MHFTNLQIIRKSAHRAEKSIARQANRRSILAIAAAVVLPLTMASTTLQASATANQSTNNDDMVLIPAGKFIMGSDRVDTSSRAGEFGNTKPWYMDEHPQHQVLLGAFYIDKYEVTNAAFLKFVIATNAAPPEHWLDNGYLLNLRKERLREQPVEKLRKLAVKLFKLDIDTRTMSKKELLTAIDEDMERRGHLPVTYTSWYQANAFCNWKGKHLPTEEQWEKAVRGAAGNEFAWGNKWRPEMSNTGDQDWPDGVAPGGAYESDKSAYGVYDLSGNVVEWTEDWYHPYPDSDYDSKDYGRKFKILRGAGWGGSGHYALKLFQRGAYRFYLPPDAAKEDLGFRCAKAVTI